MYSNEKNSGFNWKDIISKLIFLGIFLFVLIKLFPKVPNMIPFYNNVFRENISYMQEAAKSHFTTDKLPKNVGETVEISLQDMYSKNMVLPFVDKDGNSCNVYKSYASVTKNEKDYTLKINLSCNEEEDYIVETLGCYDYCERDVCTKEEAKKTVVEKVSKIFTSTSIKEYKHRKGEEKTFTSCDCPSGYIPNGEVCSKVISQKVSATPIFSTNSQKVYDASIKEGKTITTLVDKNISGGKTTYSCPDSSYTLNSSTQKCSKTNAASYTASSTTYSCPSGSIPSGSGSSLKCTTPVNKTTSCKKVSYETPKYGSSYTPLGTTTEYVCNSSRCPGYVTMYHYTLCTTTTTGGKSVSVIKTTTGGNAYCSIGTLNAAKTGCVVTTNAISKTTPTVYSCPSGTTASGSGSSMTCTATKKEANTYYCSNSEDLLVNNKCYHFEGGKFLRYSCPTGYDLNATDCYKTSSTSVDKSCKTITDIVYSYKWSTSKSLSGWTYTGETRTVKK